MSILPHIPKSSRYKLGTRIENKFIDLLETSYTAYFIEKEKKVDKLTECILVSDVLKFLMSVAWEGKVISHKQYEEIALKMGEVGKMLWGWRKSLDLPQKKNPA